MSGGGGGGGQTQTSTTMPDSEYMRMRGEVYNTAKGVYEGGQRYQGPTVAGFTSDQLTGRDNIRGNLGMGQSTYQSAIGRGQQGMGFQANQASPSQIGGAEIDRYMNPYQANVIDQTVAAQQDF